MHDVMGRKLAVGDIVLIPAIVKEVHATEDYCNVRVKSIFGRRPDFEQESFGFINTGVMLRANDMIDLFGFDDVEDDGEGEPEGATVH